MLLLRWSLESFLLFPLYHQQIDDFQDENWGAALLYLWVLHTKSRFWQTSCRTNQRSYELSETTGEKPAVRSSTYCIAELEVLWSANSMTKTSFVVFIYFGRRSPKVQFSIIGPKEFSPLVLSYDKMDTLSTRHAILWFCHKRKRVRSDFATLFFGKRF